MPGELTTRELTDMIEAYIATSGTVRAAAEHRGEEVADYWKGIAAHYGDADPKENTPPSEMDGKIVNAYIDEYSNSIHVESNRKGVSVHSRTLIAELLEYGSMHNPAYAAAARTVFYFGGDDKERTMNQKKSVGEIDLIEG